MVLTDSRTRLDGVGANAAVVELELYDVLGIGKRSVGGLLVTHRERDRDVIGCLVPHCRSAGFHRILERDHSRQGFIVYLDQIRGVLRLRQRFRHDKSDAFTDAAHFADGKDRAHRAVSLRTAPILGHERRETTELVVHDVGACQYGDNAVDGLSLGGVDALDPRVRVGRHNHHAIELLRQVHIVDIAAPASDETRILEAGNRLSDAEFFHLLPMQSLRGSSYTHQGRE